jgi:hypothetical protein
MPLNDSTPQNSTRRNPKKSNHHHPPSTGRVGLLLSVVVGDIFFHPPSRISCGPMAVQHPKWNKRNNNNIQRRKKRKKKTTHKIKNGRNELFNSSSFFFQVISLSRVPPTLSHRRDLFLLSFLTLPLLLSLSLQAEKKIIIIYFTTRHTNKNNQATTKEYRRDECDHRNPFPPFTHTHTHINVVFFNTNVYLVASIDYQDHTHPPHPPGVHFNTLCDYQQQPPNYSNKNGGGSNCFRASEKNKKKQKEAPSEFLIQKFNFSRAGGKKTKDSQYATLLSLYLSILLLYLYYTYTYYFSTYFVFWGGVPRSSCVGWFYVSAVYHFFRSCPKTS